MNEASRCRVCGAKSRRALSTREMMLGTREVFDYLECLDCGCLQIATIPDSLERYYPNDYYTEAQRVPRERSVGGLAIRRAWSRLRSNPGPWARMLSGHRYARFDWFRRTGTDLDDPILDVGCGSGRLLRRLRAEGFSQLTGIDPRWPANEDAPPGLRFARETPEEHVGRYRLVMSHHSFEHMPDPTASFAAMARLVDRGGHLLLRVPVADGWARRHYAGDWVQLDAPRHLHLPTRDTIDRLARGAGLHIVHVEDDSGPFQVWGSELYRRDVPLVEAGRGGRRVLSLAARLQARWRARQLSRVGLGDQACFYLRRD